MVRITLLAAGFAMAGALHAASPAAAVTSAAPATQQGFELALVDMQGQKKVLGTLPGSAFAPRVSPDGRRVAFEVAEPPAAPNAPETVRLQVAPLDALDKREPLQGTIVSPRNIAPVWSPDGDWIAFVATGNGADALYRQLADGWIQPKYLTDGRAVEGYYRGGANDGGTLLFITRKGTSDYGISQFDITTRKVKTLVDQPGSDQHSSRISPDGAWLAYSSNETGRHEVWLEPLPQDGRRFQITREGGSRPQWSPDGRSLYFDQGGTVFRVDVLGGGGAPQAGTPARLPISGFQQGELRRQYDLMPDGKAFLMLFPMRGAP